MHTQAADDHTARRAEGRAPRKSVLIISFSTIKRDSRVMRQIQYLSRDFDLTVLGYGEPHPDWEGRDGVRWLTAVSIFPDSSLRGAGRKFANRALLVSGRLRPKSYARMYWGQPAFRDALAQAVASGCDSIHANEWNSLPVAVEAARRLNVPVVFDAHEYSPLEFEERPSYRLLMRPMVEYLLREYAPRADASITVAPMIAERYKREFGIDPIVVMNAPGPVSVPARETDPDHIRLIYQGCAMRERQLEVMISALAMCDRRYSLHFMMTGYDPGYFEELQKLAAEVAPGRVTFRDPVLPDRVAEVISEYDMGFCFHRPINYNYLAALPNKFFECIVAGLPVCAGPSPSIAEIVRAHGLGCVAPSFEPSAFAGLLNGLSADDIVRMRDAARRAAKRINADVEMGKVVELHRSLLSGGGR